MPRIDEVASALLPFRGRYDFVDAFADDIVELQEHTIGAVAQLARMEPRPLFVSHVEGEQFTVELFEGQGIARFRLASAPRPADPVLGAAALGGVLGAALAAASGKKEGLLGGLVLGMLVGGLAGAGTPPERALALQFDPTTGEWRLYNGPLMRWAKRALMGSPVPDA